MSEPVPKRRREKYSRLICLGCRARRIRCVLPDPATQPSAQPQPADKACQRCQHNGFDCIVDLTTLGRPAQKRKPARQDETGEQDGESGRAPQSSNDDGDFVEETAEKDLEDFLMAHPDGDRSHIAELKNMKPNKIELSTSLLSPFHLMTALLERDKHFACSIAPEKPPATSILDLVDDTVAAALEPCLLWHRLIYPDIPSLLVLRNRVQDMHHYLPNRLPRLFLLTLLCDIAIDVPSPSLSHCRHLQPKVRTMLYHAGQLFLFSLDRSDTTVLALELASHYRPVILTSSSLAAGQTLKGMPYTCLATHAATDLGYNKAGPRLIEALHDVNRIGEIPGLMHACLHWVRLCCAQSTITTSFPDHILHLCQMNEDAEKCLEAMQTAFLLGLVPADILLAYHCVSSSARCLASTREAFQQWKDLVRLGDIITAHKAFNAAEEEALHGALDQFGGTMSAETSHAILQQAELERHINHINVAGSVLFFAVMHGANAASNQKGIRLDQAIEVSENIIKQLTLHDESDPDRPSHRKFLETYGRDRADQLEKGLSTFINMADSLSVAGVPYVNSSRNTVAYLLLVCKDIVESNAARLKGWGGLHERIDIQMILFVETARRLEHMSHTAGTRDALSRGCVLTAGAKLIRSLHRIMQDFKKSLLERQRRGAAAASSAAASSSSKQDSTPPIDTPESDTLAPAPTLSSHDSNWDSVVTDDLFADWDNWPQFDTMDFSDLFGSDFNWEQL